MWIESGSSAGMPSDSIKIEVILYNSILFEGEGNGCPTCNKHHLYTALVKKCFYYPFQISVHCPYKYRGIVISNNLMLDKVIDPFANTYHNERIIFA